MTTTNEILTALLTDGRAIVEKGWYQGGLAIAADGSEVNVEDPRACAHCTVGAMLLARIRYRDAHRQEPETRIDGFYAAKECAYELLTNATGHSKYSLPKWNDTPGRTKEEVLAAFDAAIAESKRIPAACP